VYVYVVWRARSLAREEQVAAGACINTFSFTVDFRSGSSLLGSASLGLALRRSSRIKNTHAPLSGHNKEQQLLFSRSTHLSNARLVLLAPR